MEITHTLPQIPDTKLHGDFKHIPHTSSNTRCHHISLRHFVYNTNKPKLHKSCSTKSKPYSMLQIKNFRCCVVKEKFRNSFVLPKKYSVREINNFPKHYMGIKPVGQLFDFLLPPARQVTPLDWPRLRSTDYRSQSVDSLTFLPLPF